MGTATGISNKANRAVTAATTVAGNEYVVVDATTAAVTITGPAAGTARRWGVKKTDASTNPVTINYLDSAGNAASVVLSVPSDGKTFESLGSGYVATAAERSRVQDDARYVAFVDLSGNPIAADRVRIVVDTTVTPHQISDIIVASA